MSAAEIDAFLKGVEEPKRSTLLEMRKRILEVVPNAEQGIKYGMPAFMLDGKCFACIAPFKNHLNYSPYSGSVLSVLSDDLANYKYSAGSLQFAIDKPLPKSLVKKLITVRLGEIKNGKPKK
ncbi:MAG: iron chaperone [Micrococcales bacterium]